MLTLIEYGVFWIPAIQSLEDWRIVSMRTFSSLGTGNFFFLMLPMICWSMNASLDIGVGVTRMEITAGS